jgi:hypothetical protein
LRLLAKLRQEVVRPAGCNRNTLVQDSV